MKKSPGKFQLMESNDDKLKQKIGPFASASKSQLADENAMDTTTNTLSESYFESGSIKKSLKRSASDNNEDDAKITKKLKSEESNVSDYLTSSIFNESIHLILKQVHPTKSIDKSAIILLDQLLIEILKKLNKVINNYRLY